MSGSIFKFANILGRRPRAEAPPPDDPTAEEQDDQQAEEQQEDAEDGDQEEAGAEEDGPEETAEEEEAPAAQDDEAPPAEARIRAKERARIGRIMASKAARGRVEAALHLAVNTGMSSRAAIALLGTLPRAGAVPAGSTKTAAPRGGGGGLAARMAGVPGAAVGPGGGGEAAPGTGGPLSFKQIQARRALRADAAALAAQAGGVFTPRRR